MAYFVAKIPFEWYCHWSGDWVKMLSLESSGLYLLVTYTMGVILCV